MGGVLRIPPLYPDSLYWTCRIQPVLMFRSTVTEGSGICLGRQFGRCPELNASRSLRRISQRRYFCVQLPPRRNLFSTHQTPTARAFLPWLSLWIVRLPSRCLSVRDRLPRFNDSFALVVAVTFHGDSKRILTRIAKSVNGNRRLLSTKPPQIDRPRASHCFVFASPIYPGRLAVT